MYMCTCESIMFQSQDGLKYTAGSVENNHVHVFADLCMDHTLISEDSAVEEKDDNISDSEYDISYAESVTISKDCCMKTVLASAVLTTAILLVVIVASHRKRHEDTGANGGHSASHQNVYWLTDDFGSHLVFRHQFLVHDVTELHPLQILAVDDDKQIYVMELRPGKFQHYSLYTIVNFKESTETYIVVAKSENKYATDFIDDMILFCKAVRFGRAFHGSFASVAEIMQVPVVGITSESTESNLAVSYIGGVLTLSHIVSLGVNSSCEQLPDGVVFNWHRVNESLACGERVSAVTDYESCPNSLCRYFPGIPLTKGQTCHKFRRCNYISAYCDPFYMQHPGTIAHHPYCSCRKTAALDAKRLACPRITDDGGECELPRRDLLVSQSNLPCQCSYRFSMVFPFITGSDILTDESEVKLGWEIRERNITGPALRFSQCLC